MSLLTRSSLRYLRMHGTQLALSVLGVALGVSVVVAIDLAIESSRVGFRVSAETVAGRATHHVTNDGAAVDETILASLRTELGLRETAPLVEGFASSTALPGRALRVLGIDPFSEDPFRPYVGAVGSALDVGSFLTEPGSLILSRPVAEEAGLTAGDTLSVLVQGRPWALRLLGTLGPQDELARSGLSDVLLVDVSTAQEMMGFEGLLSRIDLRLPDDADRLEDQIRSILPPGVRLEEAGTRTDTMAGMVAAFDLNLTALSLLALVFGMFLIYNAMTFSVVQRRPLLGRLRALGVTRSEITRVILLEALWVGMAGAFFGVMLGTVLGRGLVRLVTRTINDLYFALSVEGVTLDPLVLAKGALLGVFTTLLAALAPALEAGSAPPRVTLLRSSSEEKMRRMVPRVAWAGLGLFLGGVGLLAVPSRSIGLSFSGLFLVMLGLALTTPLGTVLLVRLFGLPLRALGGVLGSMAGRGVVSSLSRTAPAIAALVVAVSVTVGLGVMIQSFRGTLIQWLDGTLQADVYVSLPGPQAGRASGTLWPALIDDFVGHPEVVGFSTYRGVDLITPEGAYRLVALDLDPRGERAFEFLEEVRGGAMRAFQAGGGVLVSEPFAFRRDLAAGDSLRLGTDRGERSFPVVGVFRDFGSDQGTVMVARSLYDQVFDDPGVTSLGLFLEEEADGETVVNELLRTVGPDRSVVARTNRSLRAASLEVFDRTFEVTAVLRFLAFIVAFVGVLSALMALELERAREFGVLRANGLTPRQLWGLVSTQTGLVGLVSGLMAIPVGLVLSVVMIYVINRRSFGWTLEMQVGPSVILQALALAWIGAMLAGVYPAWRMSKTSPAVALRSE